MTERLRFHFSLSCIIYIKRKAKLNGHLQLEKSANEATPALPPPTPRNADVLLSKSGAAFSVELLREL